MKTGCILLAAGAGTRFGANKLLSSFQGQPLYRLALAAIPAEKLEGAAVVSGTAEILEAAAACGFIPVYNGAPEAGQSRSIRLGMEALGEGFDALLFMVADQPCLRRESVAALLAFAEARPGAIVRLGTAAGRAGNPVLFPADCFPALRALEGDRGGSSILRAYGGPVCVCTVEDERELMDVDSRAALEALTAAAEKTD